MPPTIDFATLSLQDALDLAILIEEEAKERYEEFADQLAKHHTPEAAQFFQTMAGNEAKHGADLLMRRQALFGDRTCRDQCGHVSVFGLLVRGRDRHLASGVRRGDAAESRRVLAHPTHCRNQ